MKTQKIVLAALFLGGLVLNVSAQDKPLPKDTGVISNENVIVVAEYDPTLMDFPKKNSVPQIENNVVPRTDIKYTVFPQPMKIAYQTMPIKAAKMSGEPFTELYGNYIKAGFGTGRTPYGELFLSTKRDKSKSVGLHMKHFSTNGKVPDYAFAGNSENAVDLYGSKIRTRSTLYGKLFFHRDVVHYYGFKPAEILDTLENDDYKQRYNDAGGKFAWYSTHSDSTHLNYRLNFDYHGFWDINNASENSGELSGFLNKRVQMLGITKYQVIGVRVDAQHYFNNRNYTSFNAGLVEITPFINANFGKIFLEVAPKLAMETDSTSEAYFYPYIRMELNLLPGTISAFGGWDGGITYNSYRLLANENPYIHRFVNTEYSNTRRKIYGGVRGNIARSFSYTIQAIQRDINHAPMFVNDTLTYMNNWMGVVYDSIRWFRGEFNSELKIKEKWKAYLTVAYNQAEAVNEAEVWNMPSFEGMIGIGYNLADKFLISTRVYYTGKRFARQKTDAGFVVNSLDPFIDANLSFEYRYSKVLSAFLQFNNIAAQRYMIWNQYPSYRFRFWGGVTYSF
ncbi:MAG: hypothetical protein CVU11_05295 [Bacteroidetes bacterium HGW-Bacteroidetes-6]|jgi:hypothetical protein|nr:MAG: hypothetical protein CVU11_05295 [Bacteroidetes bacterium HGW-Bacteroidetes-6]